jgi:hypothetical protein
MPPDLFLATIFLFFIWISYPSSHRSLNDTNCNTCNISDNDISIDNKNVNCTNVNNVLNIIGLNCCGIKKRNIFIINTNVIIRNITSVTICVVQTSRTCMFSPSFLCRRVLRAWPCTLRFEWSFLTVLIVVWWIASP